MPILHPSCLSYARNSSPSKLFRRSESSKIYIHSWRGNFTCVTPDTCGQVPATEIEKYGATSLSCYVTSGNQIRAMGCNFKKPNKGQGAPQTSLLSLIISLATAATMNSKHWTLQKRHRVKNEDFSSVSSSESAGLIFFPCPSLVKRFLLQKRTDELHGGEGRFLS